MSVWDYLSGIKSKLSARQGEQPQIIPLQMPQDGSVDHAASLALKNQTTPLTLGERLTGRTMSEDFQTINPKTGETKLETVTNYRPGLFNDITGGYRENRFTPASLSNFGQNTLDDGRRKGLAYRFGEGLGSLAKFAESPLGRSLLVGGIVGATGGSGLEALAYGGTAGMLNQANRSADKIYRDDLIQSQQNALKNSPEFNALSPKEQQRQMQSIADNIYSQRGYINKDIYSNLINTQQIRDNADWKRLYFDTQQKNLETNRAWQREEARMRREDAAANRAFQYYQANLGHQDRIAALEAQNKGNNADIENLLSINEQLDNFRNSFSGVNNPYRYRIAGKGSEFLNTLKPNEANFKSQSSLLLNKIARDLGGEKGVLSDQDINRIREAMPTLSDTTKQKDAKMSAIYDLLALRMNAKGIPFENPYKLNARNSGFNVDYNAIDAELARRGAQ